MFSIEIMVIQSIFLYFSNFSTDLFIDWIVSRSDALRLVCIASLIINGTEDNMKIDIIETNPSYTASWDLVCNCEYSDFR